MSQVTARFELFATDVAALTEFLRDALNFETVRETPDYGYTAAVPLGRRSWGLRDFRLVAPDGYYFRVTSRNIEG